MKNILFLISFLPSAWSAQWISPVTSSGTTVSTGNTVSAGNTADSEPQSCDDFCSQFKKVDGKAQSITSSSVWNSEDDALCSSLNVATSSTQPGLPSNSDYTSMNCDVPLNDKMVSAIHATPSSDPTSTCSAARKVRDLCKYHNSIVENHCWAYLASSINQSIAYSVNAGLLALDYGVAATCGVACYTLNPVASGACGAGDILAGGAEIAATIAMSQSPINSYIEKGSMNLTDYMSAAGGGAGTLLGAGKVTTSVLSYQAQQSGSETATKTANLDQMKSLETKTQSLVDERATLEAKRVRSQGTYGDKSLSKLELEQMDNRINDLTQDIDNNRAELSKLKSQAKNVDEAEELKNAKNLEDTKTADRVMACASAFLYTVLGSVRAADLILIKKTADNECQSVQKYRSQASSVSSSGTYENGSGTSATAIGSGTSTNQENNSANSTGEGSGISNHQPGQVQEAPPGFIACFNQNTPQSCASSYGVQAFATDAGLLLRSPTAGGLLKNVDAFALSKKVHEGGAAAALASILPNGGAGEFASLVGMAKMAQDQADQLRFSRTGGFSDSSYSSSPSTTTSLTQNRLGSFLTNKFNDLTSGFGGRSPSSAGIVLGADIWHAGSQSSIFEIVSDRITQVSPRLK